MSTLMPHELCKLLREHKIIGVYKINDGYTTTIGLTLDNSQEIRFVSTEQITVQTKNKGNRDSE